MSSRLLTETITTTFALTEDKNTGKLVARGEFGRADVPTQNGRRYPRAIYEREVTKLQEDIAKRRVLMECDHPASGKSSLARAAALLTEATIDKDGIVRGAAELLDTPNGRILKALMQHGVEIGVSSRGFGSTKPSESGEGEDVCEDYNLKTWDFVADPAMKSAYPEVFTEDVNAGIDMEGLREEIPEVFAAIEEGLMDRAMVKAQEQIQAAASKDVVAAVAVARDEERERFGRGLVEALQGLHEEVKQELREEAAADGSAAVLSQVSQLLRPYLPEAPADHVAEALAAQQDEIAALREQAGEWRALAREAGYQLLAERLVVEHPHAEMARELLSDAGLLESEDAVRARVGGVLQQLEALPQPPNPVAEATGKWRGERERLLTEAQEIHSRLAEKSVQLRQAVEGAERLEARATEAERRVAALQQDLSEARAAADLAAYKAESVVGQVNGRALLQLLEGADSKADVDRLVRERGRTTMGDGQLERMRAQTQRAQGQAAMLHAERAVAPRGAGSAGIGDLAYLGLDADEARALAGL